MKYLDVFAYHSYGSDDNVSEKAEFGKWAKENIKTPRFDMSEWCELPCKNDTKSIESALIMARIIGEDLIYTGVDSWSAWVCANQWDNAVRDGKCFSDGFIVAKDDFSVIMLQSVTMQWLISQNVFLMVQKALISALILLVASRFLHLKEQTAKR